MRLIVITFLTADGVMQAPGAPEEDRGGGFEHGGWQVPYMDEDTIRLIHDWYTRVDAFLLGRRTYDIFAAHWPHVPNPDEDPIARQLNTLPKYVVSGGRPELSWQNSTLVTGDVPEEIRKLKALPGGELQVWGSGRLATTLMEHGLVDEYRLLTYPVVLGGGQRLFAEATPTALRVVDSTVTGSGTVITTYQPTGSPEYGSFALDQS
ncbi:dihydrofolate reductase family protein [Streptomyces sp. TS71-3]|uniref:dihydrofolate reductase family protein n=1 Tax=Streptomyces sp. TS71-3 TaxID=2733862 RepID=UPI001B10C88F|nr:dihydrofolate reductase family protein [Streptomyces sp. TS71-3]GHJ39663.1 deaminase reductase [Streptomyces sp. TS71-3]